MAHPGRKKGATVAVRDLHCKFDVVYFRVLHRLFGRRKNEAARSAAALADKIFAVAEGRTGFRLYRPLEIGEYDDPLQGRANGIAIRANMYGTRATADARDLEWLEKSSGYAYSWLHAAAHGDRRGMSVAVRWLRQVDPAWGRELVELEAAVSAAPLLSFATTQDRVPLPRALNKLLIGIWRRGGKDRSAIYRGGFQTRKSVRRGS